jgi:hypothetical protein
MYSILAGLRTNRNWLGGLLDWTLERIFRFQQCVHLRNNGAMTSSIEGSHRLFSTSAVIVDWNAIANRRSLFLATCYFVSNSRSVNIKCPYVYARIAGSGQDSV